MNTKLLSWFPKALFIPIMLFLITLFGSQTARAAGVCYVNASAGGSNNGSSWANAYTDLQSALGASPCTEVWVAAGTYKPTSDANRAISFMLRNGVALYGGFAGAEADRSQRDPAANVTILSGDIGTIGNIVDNSYHVVNGGGTDGTAVLDGFTITAGNANGSSFPDNSGGGMLNDNSSPTLTNLIFSGNSASGAGGMYNSGSPTLTNVTFSSNSATFVAGGMYNSGSPTLTNVTFSSNSAVHDGGGMYNYNSSPVLINVTFSNNSAAHSHYGGLGDGGGIYNDNSSPILTNVTFSGNGAWNGGGMYNTNSNPILTNVTFSGNGAWNGGGMYNTNSSPTLINVTFGGNSGGGMWNLSSSSPQIKDSILWGNNAFVAGSEIYNDTSSNPSLADSLVAGGCPFGATCTNLLTTDPLLGPLANNGGFTQTMALLGAGSSAIDTGNDATCASTDQRGVARPQGAHCDMGAYEWVGHIISGNAEVAGATLSYTDGLPQTGSADGSGNYTLMVTDGWSGTVTPSTPGWSFTPDHRDYVNVLSDLTGQGYTATRTGYVISGNVGLAGTTLSYTDGSAKTAQADGNGNYAFAVSFNWSGIVTPSNFNYIFTPDNRSYTNLSADQPDQDYTPIIYKIYLPLVRR